MTTLCINASIELATITTLRASSSGTGMAYVAALLLMSDMPEEVYIFTTIQHYFNWLHWASWSHWEINDTISYTYLKGLFFTHWVYYTCFCTGCILGPSLSLRTFQISGWFLWLVTEQVSQLFFEFANGIGTGYWNFEFQDQDPCWCIWATAQRKTSTTWMPLGESTVSLVPRA